MQSDSWLLRAHVMRGLRIFYLGTFQIVSLCRKDGFVSLQTHTAQELGRWLASKPKGEKAGEGAAPPPG